MCGARGGVAAHYLIIVLKVRLALVVPESREDGDETLDEGRTKAGVMSRNFRRSERNSNRWIDGVASTFVNNP